MSVVWVKCPHCRGSGRRSVTGVYLDTLVLLRKRTTRGEHTMSNRDAPLFGCQPTALNNRLARLEELGLVRSERYGRERRFWSV